MEYTNKEKVIELLYKFHVDKACEDCMDAIECLPSEDVVERATGFWIDDEVDDFSKGFGYKKFHCSNCNSYFSGTHVEKTDFCPNCGAKMR